MDTETIVAVASSSGRGGIGVVRLSGPDSAAIQAQICGRTIAPRTAVYAVFREENGDAIDDGIALLFPAPGSYTGEEVAELQGHGNPVLLERLVARACELGARSARPGEFTERAYRNGRLDLAQAEAVADLINSATLRTARAARRTMEGAFGTKLTSMIETLRAGHAMLEASIDFGDDVASEDLLDQQLTLQQRVVDELRALLTVAQKGVRLHTGAVVVLAGAPNVGKSSLMNALTQIEHAIVTPHAGTTRDVLHCDLVIRGLPVRLLDTAGLREEADEIEREGIRRARQALNTADLIIEVLDAQTLTESPQMTQVNSPEITAETIRVFNKADLLPKIPADVLALPVPELWTSAVTGYGIDALAGAIAGKLGIAEEQPGDFMARARHVSALKLALAELEQISRPVCRDAPELAAEHYRTASKALETIVGRHSTEDLLADVFSRFCIGK